MQQRCTGRAGGSQKNYPNGWQDNNVTHRNPGFSNRYGPHHTKVTTYSDGSQAVNNIRIPKRKNAPDLNKLIPEIDEYNQVYDVNPLASDGRTFCADRCAFETYDAIFAACQHGTVQCDYGWIVQLQFDRTLALCIEVECGGVGGGGKGKGGGKARNSTKTRSTAKPKNMVPDPAQRFNGSCKLNSFTPQTLVLMADGSTKKIADIKVDDEVLATDPETGRTEARAVTAKLINDDHAFTDVTVLTSAGKRTVVRTTREHLFWDSSFGIWVRASNLKTSSTLRAADGSQQQVQAVRSYADTRWMYNLTVSDIHTYFVVAGGASLLVHNDCSNDQGVYVFDDKNAGLPYVGQAASFDDRLGKHARRGRRDKDGHVTCIHVCGDQAAREAVEADVIDLLGGLDKLANEKNFPGLKRRGKP